MDAERLVFQISWQGLSVLLVRIKSVLVGREDVVARSDEVCVCDDLYELIGVCNFTKCVSDPSRSCLHTRERDRAMVYGFVALHKLAAFALQTDFLANLGSMCLLHFTASVVRKMNATLFSCKRLMVSLVYGGTLPER